MADCATPDCAAATNAWTAAARIHQIKNVFVGAVGQFAEAVAGTYGDEGSRVSSTLASMQSALSSWDRAIGDFEVMVGPADAIANADIHVALGTVYLDRSRVDQALREFAAAGRLDPRRVDVQTSSALAHDLALQPAQAAEALARAATLEPDNPIIFYDLAQRLARVGRTDDARLALQNFQRVQQEAIESGKQPAPAPFERVNLLRQSAGVAPIFPLVRYARGFELLTAGRYEAAIAELRVAAATDPLQVESRADVVASAADLRQGRLQPAVGALEAAIKFSPNDSEAHRILGVAYWAEGQFDSSVDELGAAVRLDPSDERSVITLADVLVAARRLAEAERLLAAVIRTLPESGQAHDRLAQVYQAQSQPAEAVRELERASMLNPLVGLDRLYERIGGLHADQANFDATVDAYLKRVEVNPNNADAHRKLGEIYFLQGRHAEALAEFTATLLLDPREAEAHAASGQVYLRLGEYARAVRASRQALALDPDHVKARYTLATSLLRLGQTEEGTKELEVVQRRAAEAAAATQRQAEWDATRLEAARSLGREDYDRAIGLLREAIAARPNQAASYLDLGLALTKAGRHQDAIDAFNNALQLEDGADVHRYLADTFKALGRADDSQAQYRLYERMVERNAEERLKKLAGAR